MPLNPRTGLPVRDATIPEAAKYAGRSERAVFYWLRAGKLTRYRRANRIFLDLNEIDALNALVPDTTRTGGGDAA